MRTAQGYVPVKVMGQESKGFQPGRAYPAVFLDVTNTVRVFNEEGRVFALPIDAVRCDVSLWRQQCQLDVTKEVGDEMRLAIGHELHELLEAVNEFGGPQSRSKMAQHRSRFVAPIRAIAESIGADQVVEQAYQVDPVVQV